MTLIIKNKKNGVVVDIGGEDIALFNGGAVNHVQFPANGITESYDFDIKGNSQNFVVVYSCEAILDGNQIGSNWAQFYKWDGQSMGVPIWLTSQTNQGHRPGIGVLNNGDYIAMWQTNNPLGYPELGDRIGYIVGRYIKYDGSYVGDTFVIATGTNLIEEGSPPAISEKNGQIIVSWSAYSSQFDTVNVKNGDSDISHLIKGGPGPDTWYTFGGDDRIYGYAGDDFVDSGAGADIVDAGLNNDTISSGFGDDTVLSGSGDDFVYSGDGDDVVNAGAGADLIIGGSGAGNDFYDGGTGIDTIKYLSAKAGITVNLLKDKSNAYSTESGDLAGIGVDSLKGIENVIAGDYNDRITGNNSANEIRGELGDDYIDAAGGNDTVIGFDGNDTLLGGAGNDLIDGMADDDRLVGGVGKDTLTGGEGHDTFVFNSGDTGATASTRDVITDFVSGADKIDLSTIDAMLGVTKNDAFTFYGNLTQEQVATTITKANANGALWFSNGVLYGSTDKDVAPEFQIELIGVTTVFITDFIL